MDTKEYRKQYYIKNKDKKLKYSNEYNKKNRDKIIQRYIENKDVRADYQKWYNIKKTYGLSIEEVDHMKISQNECCAICGNKFINTKDMHIDHNHITGKVRQLLCRGCNHGLGHFRENPLLLDKAKEYLNKWL
jgi:hypothetical protein